MDSIVFFVLNFASIPFHSSTQFFNMHLNPTTLLVQLLLASTSLALVIPSTTHSSTPTSLVDLSERQPTKVEKATTTAAPTGYYTTTQTVIIDGVTNSQVTIPAKTILLTLPTCHQTLKPDKNGYLPPGTCNAIWNYYPSFAAALVFAGLFAIMTAVHIWQAARYKKVRMLNGSKSEGAF